MTLVACEIEIHSREEREQVVGRLRSSTQPPLMILDTCQRLESFGHTTPELDGIGIARSWGTREAFERLACIAAGLESRVPGELEILGQVRRAYKSFRHHGGSDASRMDRIFQDVLSLARKARRESGIDKNLISISGLASSELLKRVPSGKPIAVVGSGSLAGSVVRYLSKRGGSPIRVFSRCPDKAMELANKVGGFGAGLDQLSYLLEGVAGILTATAAPHPVIYPHHLVVTERPVVIVDLGEPADCSAGIQSLMGENYLGLLDVEREAHINTSDRLACGEVAREIIRKGAETWCATRSSRLAR